MTQQYALPMTCKDLDQCITDQVDRAKNRKYNGGNGSFNFIINKIKLHDLFTTCTPESLEKEFSNQEIIFFDSKEKAQRITLHILYSAFDIILKQLSM